MNYIINSTHSPFYCEEKFFRAELEKLRELKYKSTTTDYAYYFLTLLSQAESKNVDYKGTVPINEPNLYISVDDLLMLFNINRTAILFKLLNHMQDSLNVIQYCKRKTKIKGIYQEAIYVHFNVCNERILNEASGYDFYANRNAIKKREGFFLVNKKSIFEAFFKNKKYRHGPRDLYILLRLNTVRNSEHLEACMPIELKLYSMALFQFSGNDKPRCIDFIPLFHQKQLANFLKTDEKTISRFMSLLQDADLISYETIHKRGTAINFRYLDLLYGNPIEKELISLMALKILEFINDYNSNEIDDSITLHNRSVLMLSTLCKSKSAVSCCSESDEYEQFYDIYGSDNLFDEYGERKYA